MASHSHGAIQSGCDWPISHWTDKNLHVCNGLKISSVFLKVCNFLMLCWQSPTVLLVLIVLTVYKCLESLEESWQCVWLGHGLCCIWFLAGLGPKLAAKWGIKFFKKNLNVWTCNIYIVLIWRRKKHNFIFLTKDNFGWHQPFLVAYSDWQPIIDCSYFKLGFCPSQTWLPKFEIGCHRGHLSVTLGDSHLWTYLCVVMAALNLLSPYNEKVWNLLVHL